MYCQCVRCVERESTAQNSVKVASSSLTRCLFAQLWRLHEEALSKSGRQLAQTKLMPALWFSFLFSSPYVETIYKLGNDDIQGLSQCLQSKLCHISLENIGHRGCFRCYVTIEEHVLCQP